MDDLTLPPPPYAELQVTSNFSFLEGAAHPEELVAQAARLGHKAIAITDRNTLAGVVRAHLAARETGIRLVVGARLDFTDSASLLCLPTNRISYGKLSQLITLGRRRAPKGECHLGLSDFLAYSNGQIAIVIPPSKNHPAKNFPDHLRRIVAAMPVTRAPYPMLWPWLPRVAEITPETQGCSSFRHCM